MLNVRQMLKSSHLRLTDIFFDAVDRAVLKLTPPTTPNDMGDQLVFDIRNGNLEQAAKYMAAGANLYRKPMSDTALTASLKGGHFTLAKKLLAKGTAIDRKDGSGNPPLALALKAKRTDICLDLIEKKCRLDLKDGGGHTPLDLACALKNKTVEQAIRRSRAVKSVQRGKRAKAKRRAK